MDDTSLVESILPGGLPASLIKLFESLGLPYEAHVAQQQSDFLITDQRALVNALVAGQTYYH